MKYTIQEDIGRHFLDNAVQLVKEGKKFVLVLDNIDWDVKVHDMRSGQQNKSVHAFVSSIVFDRVSSDHLPNKDSQRTVRNCNLISYSLPIKKNSPPKSVTKFLLEGLCVNSSQPFIF